MRRLTVLVTATALLAAAPTASLPVLDQWLSFVDPHSCEASEQLNTFLHSVSIWDESSTKMRIGKLDVPAAYQAFVGKPTLSSKGFEHTFTIPIKGTWHGLPMHSIVVFEREESEGGFQFVFNAPPSAVREVVNQQGFNVPRSGWRDPDDGADIVIGVFIGVSRYNGRGSLNCFVG